MLFALALYACVTSFYYRLRWHRKLVVPSSPSFVGKLTRGWLRSMVPLTIVGFMFVLASDGVIKDPIGPGMVPWFKAYFSSHSFGWWFLWNAVMYFIIALPKEATYKAQLRPVEYGPETTEPPLHRIDMSNSLIWNTIFWVAVFINPALPFGNAFMHALR